MKLFGKSVSIKLPYTMQGTTKVYTKEAVALIDYVMQENGFATASEAIAYIAQG